jgi:hypothetical protein
MKTLLIDDMRSDIRVLAVDLRHVLAAPWAARHKFSVACSRRMGHGRQIRVELESFDDTTTVSGQRLRELAEDVTQVIDGVFSGFESGSAEPWVVIDAVDSSYYLVRSDDSSVLDAIRSTFRQVSDYGQPVT